MTNYVVESVSTRDPLIIAQYFELAHNIPISSSQRGSTACKKYGSTCRFFGMIDGEYGVYPYSKVASSGAIILQVNEVEGKEEPVVKMSPPVIVEQVEKPIKKMRSDALVRKEYKIDVPNCVVAALNPSEIQMALLYFKEVLGVKIPGGFYRSKKCAENSEIYHYGVIDNSFDVYTKSECVHTNTKIISYHEAAIAVAKSEKNKVAPPPKRAYTKKIKVVTTSHARGQNQFMEEIRKDAVELFDTPEARSMDNELNNQLFPGDYEKRQFESHNQMSDDEYKDVLHMTPEDIKRYNARIEQGTKTTDIEREEMVRSFDLVEDGKPKTIKDFNATPIHGRFMTEEFDYGKAFYKDNKKNGIKGIDVIVAEKSNYQEALKICDDYIKCKDRFNKIKSVLVFTLNNDVQLDLSVIEEYNQLVEKLNVS